jgi:hypothetical protein
LKNSFCFTKIFWRSFGHSPKDFIRDKRENSASHKVIYKNPEFFFFVLQNQRTGGKNQSCLEWGGIPVEGGRRQGKGVGEWICCKYYAHECILKWHWLKSFQE